MTLVITAAMAFAVITPIVFFASAGHGYLPPMGVAILAIALAQIVGVIGYGEYFPWAIPGVYSQGEQLGAVELHHRPSDQRRRNCRYFNLVGAGRPNTLGCHHARRVETLLSRQPI